MNLNYKTSITDNISNKINKTLKGFPQRDATCTW